MLTLHLLNFQTEGIAVGACGGDSGGPLIKFKELDESANATLKRGYYEQVAIVKGGGCGTYAGTYTRLGDPKLFKWMQSVIFGKTTASK